MSARVVVVGTLASIPYPGTAWMHMQITAGFRRLGHDAHCCETTSSWPYDPLRDHKVCDSDYAAPYLARVAESFGIGDRWAYRRSFSERPAVVQETGFSDSIPTGRGLFSFTTRAEALEAIAEIAVDPDGHAIAASEITREHFEASRVLSDIVRRIGLL